MMFHFELLQFDFNFWITQDLESDNLTLNEADDNYGSESSTPERLMTAFVALYCLRCIPGKKKNTTKFARHPVQLLLCIVQK